MKADEWKTLDYTQNREYSWLKFNEKVLEEANDETVPLLERLKFISIFENNLTEFFMVRVGKIYDILDIKEDRIDIKSGMSESERLNAILSSCTDLYSRKDEIYSKVNELLKEYGIFNLDIDELTNKEKEYISNYFDAYILPILSIQIIDKKHPFPHLNSGAAYIALHLEKISYKKLKYKSKEIGVKRDKLGLISLMNIPEYLTLSLDKKRIILMDKIVKYFSWKLFKYYKVLDSYTISVTRNADVSPDPDDSRDNNYIQEMQKILKRRRILQSVRLETDKKFNDFVENLLIKNLKLSKKSIFTTKAPIHLKFVFKWISSLPNELIEKISYKKFTPVDPIMVDNNRSMIEQIREKDILLSFPYESINPFIKLLREAAEDPKVVSIKITIYRLSKVSRIAEQLAYAVENGKDVIIIMELRARFDEENNIEWSKKLEEEGCHIIYGIENYKVHSKICLITYADDNGDISYITQVGTGNYNENTSKQYTDFSLMTASKEIGKDTLRFFNNMLISNINAKYNELMVAPLSLQEKLKELINEEIIKAQKGEEAYMCFKLNSLSDMGIINLLSDASNAGVKIDLFIRGICCILPNIKDKTKNIKVYSLVGRFLEHNRIYIFGKGEKEKIYISSADFMTRNIRNRIEVACPIYSEEIKKSIKEYINIMLLDNIKRTELLYNGEYVKINDGKKLIDAQNTLLIDYQEKYKEKLLKIKKKPKTNSNSKLLNEKRKLEKEINDLVEENNKKTFWEKLKDLFK